MIPNNEDIILRVKELVAESKLSKSRFAIEVGINTSNFGKKLDGKLGFTDFDIRHIVEKTGVRISWLLTGEGQKFEAPEEFKKQVAADTNSEGIPLIPTSAMAGALGCESTTINPWDIEDTYIVPAFKKSDFCIRVEGDSMSPRYYRGDILACRRVPLTDIWFQWGAVYVIDTNQGPLVKHVEPGSDNEHIKLVSDNPSYKPFEISRRDLYGIAIVNGLIRVE